VSFFVGFFLFGFSVCRARNPSRAAGACACPLLLSSALWRCFGLPDTGGLAVPALPPCRTSRGGFFVASMRFQSFNERTRKNSGWVAAGSWYTLFVLSFSASLVVRCVSRFRRCRGVSVLCLNPLTMHKYTKIIDTVNTQSKIFLSFSVDNVNT